MARGDTRRAHRARSRRAALIRHFDVSALAKRYVRAEGTIDVNRWLRQGHAATSRLTEAELSSAFALLLRDRAARPIDFVVYDDRLAAAARAERLRVLP